MKTITKFFTANWEETDAEHAVYAVRLTMDETGRTIKSEQFVARVGAGHS